VTRCPARQSASKTGQRPPRFLHSFKSLDGETDRGSSNVCLPAGPATLWSLRFPAAELCLLFGVESSSSDNRFNEVLAATRSHAPEFMGLSEVPARALAENLGIELRVRSKDEPITADSRARRLTVDLSTGVVTDARAG